MKNNDIIYEHEGLKIIIDKHEPYKEIIGIKLFPNSVCHYITAEKAEALINILRSALDDYYKTLSN